MVLLDRTLSECSDDIDIRPLELTDLQRGLDENDEDVQNCVHNASGLTASNKFFSVVYGIRRRSSSSSEEHHKHLMACMAWRNAFNKVQTLDDPWKGRDVEGLTTERGKRYRYRALQKEWVVDEVSIKMEDTPFNHGAMRECFRMKKLSNFSNDDWSKAHNYVAKRYMDSSTCRDTYFDDVKLQMDAKLWGEEYNRHNPPKKVDIFQMVVLELSERPGAPLFHVEHFIEGVYIKYNSNSGYVSSSNHRMTPHAFSHFSFEKSGHSLIVVDVQGVGDLYTDPQIHTVQGHEYGVGNLGTRGMALFFHSHECNGICRSLGLSQFDMSPSEIKQMQRNQRKHAVMSAQTIVRGSEELVTLPTEEQRSDLHEYLRQRSESSGCLSYDDQHDIAAATAAIRLDSYDSLESAGDAGLEHLVEESDASAIGTIGRGDSPVLLRRSGCRYPRARNNSATAQSKLPVDVGETDSGLMSGSNGDLNNERNGGNDLNSGGSNDDVFNGEKSFATPTMEGVIKGQRGRYDSMSSECGSITKQQDLANFTEMVKRSSQPSNIVSEDEHQEMLLALDVARSISVNTILGQIHLDVAKYYELQRFSGTGDDNSEDDGEDTWQEAAVYHVMQAGRCGVLEGLLGAAQLHLGLPHCILPNVEIALEERDEALGFSFLEEACRAGERSAIIYVATAYENGIELPQGRIRNWTIAVSLLERALTATDGGDDEGGYDPLVEYPPYTLRARQAAMLTIGGHGLPPDPNRAGLLYSDAASLATTEMKGKLAAGYYMAAENAWMLCEDEEEES